MACAGELGQTKLKIDANQQSAALRAEHIPIGSVVDLAGQLIGIHQINYDFSDKIDTSGARL